jgi:hypothetical protein
VFIEIFHAVIAVIGTLAGMAFPEGYLVVHPPQSSCGARMNETIGSFNQAFADQIRAELA